MTKPSPNKTPAEYEKLGRMLENIYETGYIDQNQAYKHSFIKGLLGGLGGVIGATIVVALVIWLLSLFKEIPLVGPVVDSVRHTINNRPR
jgi:hypothetical protein